MVGYSVTIETPQHRLLAFSAMHSTVDRVREETILRRQYASFAALPDSFRQAELAAQLGLALWGGNRAVHHSDLGVHRVLFALREHEEMITPALQRLIDHDARHHSDYVNTLAAYLACMGRLRPTAARLNVHRNTLEYRLRRIEQLIGESLDDPNSRLALELGTRLLDLQRRAEVAP